MAATGRHRHVRAISTWLLPARMIKIVAAAATSIPRPRACRIGSAVRPADAPRACARRTPTRLSRRCVGTRRGADLPDGPLVLLPPPLPLVAGSARAAAPSYSRPRVQALRRTALLTLIFSRALFVTTLAAFLTLLMPAAEPGPGSPRPWLVLRSISRAAMAARRAGHRARHREILDARAGGPRRSWAMPEPCSKGFQAPAAGRARPRCRASRHAGRATPMT